MLSTRDVPVPTNASGPRTILHAILAHQEGSVEIDASSTSAPVRRSVADLLEVSERVAAGLVAGGVGPGDRVLSLLPTSHEFVALLLGCWRIRAVPVPLAWTANPRRRAQAVERVSRVANLCGARAVVAEEVFGDLGAALPATARQLPVGALVRHRALPVSHGRDLEPDPEDLAFLQFTSGSTAEPRGVMVRHRNLMSNLVAMVERLGVRNVRRTVTWLPVFHDMGLVGGMLLPLFTGGDVRALTTERFMADPVTWLQAVSDFDGRSSPVPAFALSLVAQRLAGAARRDLDLGGWPVSCVGAEPVFHQAVQAFQEGLRGTGLPETTIRPSYGLAEATLAVSFDATGTPRRTLWLSQEALRRAGEVIEASEGSKGAIPLLGNGTPLQGIEVRIASQDGHSLPEGREGRLLVRGDSVTEGYWGHEERRGPADWLDTGDLGFLLDGEVFVTGRVKDLIIRSGVNYHPHDLERAALAVPGLPVGAAAAISTVRHERAREEVVLVAETRCREESERRSLVRAVAGAVAREAGVQVDRVLLVPPRTLPRTTSGKLQRGLLRSRYEAGELDSVASEGGAA